MTCRSMHLLTRILGGYELHLVAPGTVDLFRLRLCGNDFGNQQQDAVATAAARQAQVGDRKRGSEGALPLLRSHLRDQSLGAKDLDHSLQVVCQNLQTHLGSHSR